MKMQIKKLFITSKIEQKYREIAFQEGKINFIVGNSLTGKTAIIFIIDYILGSDSSQIPSGIILQKVDWFGMVCSLDNNETLIVARRNPDISKMEVFLDIGKDICVPEVLAANIPFAEFKKRLDLLANLPEMDFKEGSADEKNGFKNRAGFRDLAAFLYQPQYIIANPTSLFFKTESFEHREKLKVISELVLDIIDATIMQNREKIKQIQEELEACYKEKKELKKIAESKKEDLLDKLLLATRAGLLDKTIHQNMKSKEMFNLLLEVVENYKKNPFGVKDTENLVNEKLLLLKKEEQTLALALRELLCTETRLHTLINTTSCNGMFRETFQIQADRLYISENLKISQEKCPFCHSIVKQENESLKRLQEALRETEASLEVLDLSSSNFIKQLTEVEKDVASKKISLRKIQRQISALESESKEKHQDLLTQGEVARLIGGIEEFIELYRDIGDSAGLDTKINQLQSQLADIQDIISEKEIKEKREKVRKFLADRLTSYASQLNIEYPDSKAEFDWKALTVVIQTDEMQRRYLSMLGSGANWLSYHIAAMLALAEYFSTFQSFVPSFLIFDQPSQVYFPTKEKEAKVITKKDISTEYTTDEQAVRKIFSLISAVVEKLSPSLQVIILEHADESLWGDLPNVHLAARWNETNQEKLIPSDWK